MVEPASAPTARIEIRYCPRCGWLPRAVWLAQELLGTFAAELAEVALVPAAPGTLEILVEGERVFSRADGDALPDPKALKQAVRDRVAPGKALGHSER